MLNYFLNKTNVFFLRKCEDNYFFTKKERFLIIFYQLYQFYFVI